MSFVLGVICTLTWLLVTFFIEEHFKLEDTRVPSIMLFTTLCLITCYADAFRRVRKANKSREDYKDRLDTALFIIKKREDDIEILQDSAECLENTLDDVKENKRQKSRVRKVKVKGIHLNYIGGE